MGGGGGGWGGGGGGGGGCDGGREANAATSTHPPTPVSSSLFFLPAYVMSGFSSTVIMVTDGSIFGGSGIWIWYLLRSTLKKKKKQLTFLMM